MAITQDNAFDAEMLEQWQRAIAQIGQGSLECCFKGRGSGGETKLNFTQLNAWKGWGKILIQNWKHFWSYHNRFLNNNILAKVS